MKHTVIVVGDILILAAITLTGFANHAEFGLSFLPRMAATFVPLCVAWFLLAPWFGLFREPVAGSATQLWRPAFVMLFAGPLAVILRGLWLEAPVMPIFAVVLTLTSTLGLTLWRMLWWSLKRLRSG